jgi:imidazolonepropionase-like amidohydrolase
MWDNLAYARERLPNLRINLRRVLAAGVPVAIGTDAGFPGVVPGVSAQLELILHVESGVSPLEAIRLSTMGGARMPGRETETGSLGPGKAADLVVLDADPIADIHNLRKVSLVLKGGVVYKPDALLR